MPTPRSEFEGELMKDLARFAKDPYAFVLWAFDWKGNTELKDHSIEPWQKKLLCEIRDGVKSVNQVVQEAARSGHGVGKSALISWIIFWGISTMGDTRGIVTANTDTQLRTKTWPELAKWYGRFIAKHLFHFTATSLYSVDPDHEKTWRIDAIPWSDSNTEAFAGLHNEGRRVIIIFDEASAISDKIWEVVEGATTDANTEIVWCAFGNPTRTVGRFRDCFNSLRHRWNTHTVDSREVSFTNKEQIKKWAEDYGEDSDFFRVRVRGVEPKSAEGQFISHELVEAARGKHLREDQYNFAPVILTLDNAWTGGDEIIIGKRQGLAFSILAALPTNDDDMKIAGLLARLEDEHRADVVFIDLGYGTGVFSAGKQLGRQWVLVAFGGESTDKGFLNKRAEMYRDAREWLRGGGAIPNDPILCADLTGPLSEQVTSGKNMGKVFIESKKDMKKRGLASPNRGDALVMSFAMPVRKKDSLRKQEFVSKTYDVLDMHEPQAKREYDPLRF